MLGLKDSILDLENRSNIVEYKQDWVNGTFDALYSSCLYLHILESSSKYSSSWMERCTLTIACRTMCSSCDGAWNLDGRITSGF